MVLQGAWFHSFLWLNNIPCVCVHTHMHVYKRNMISFIHLSTHLSIHPPMYRHASFYCTSQILWGFVFKQRSVAILSQRSIYRCHFSKSIIFKLSYVHCLFRIQSYSTCPRAHALPKEKPLQWEVRAPQLQSSLPWLEKALEQRQRSSIAKNK